MAKETIIDFHDNLNICRHFLNILRNIQTWKKLQVVQTALADILSETELPYHGLPEFMVQRNRLEKPFKTLICPNLEYQICLLQYKFF